VDLLAKLDPRLSGKCTKHPFIRLNSTVAAFLVICLETANFILFHEDDKGQLQVACPSSP